MKTILAVAVGNPANDQTFDTPNPNLSTVRPYIKGLVSWLANQPDPPTPDSTLSKYKIGVDYKIVYRERDVGSLPDAFPEAVSLPADLIFCMSTSVAKAADAFTKVYAPSKPIVAIVSDPFSELFGDNVCGVSASRDRLASHCLRQFKKKNPNVNRVYALHRDGYAPSIKAKGWIGGKKVTTVAIADGDNIRTKIEDILQNAPPKSGFLILPADRFFGSANDIVQWTGTKPTFWSTPDFPAGSFGGYGFKQELCGQFMGERVANIWTSQDSGDPSVMPDPKWVSIGPEYVTVRPLAAVKASTKKPPAKRRSEAKK
jgi:hypothetical protein